MNKWPKFSVLASIVNHKMSFKPQLHWASLLAARRRVYNLLVNSPSVIMSASKLAACKKADSKVEHVTCSTFASHSLASLRFRPV